MNWLTWITWESRSNFFKLFAPNAKWQSVAKIGDIVPFSRMQWAAVRTTWLETVDEINGYLRGFRN
jgi:hypothetical protein